MNLFKRIYYKIFWFFYIDIEKEIQEYNRLHPLKPVKNDFEGLKCIIKSR